MTSSPRGHEKVLTESMRSNSLCLISRSICRLTNWVWGPPTAIWGKPWESLGSVTENDVDANLPNCQTESGVTADFSPTTPSLLEENSREFLSCWWELGFQAGWKSENDDSCLCFHPLHCFAASVSVSSRYPDAGQNIAPKLSFDK